MLGPPNLVSCSSSSAGCVAMEAWATCTAKSVAMFSSECTSSSVESSTSSPAAAAADAGTAAELLLSLLALLAVAAVMAAAPPASGPAGWGCLLLALLAPAMHCNGPLEACI